MIQIVNAPEANRILLDGNNTEIIVTSTNGVGYYFRAKIYINDELFDEQSWSRSNNFTAQKDLIYLYNAYYKAQFPEVFTSSIEEQTHFTKKVSIEVSEYLISDDTLIESIDLPEFYIQFNTKSTDFNDEDKVVILGIEPEVLRVPTNGKIVVPFYVNAEDEDVLVSATLNDDTTFDTKYVATFTGKKVFLYTLNLEVETISYYHLYFTVKILVGSTVVEKVYKLIRNPHYQVKELVFQNNFGFYIPAYFDGEFETSNGYKVETFQQYNETEIIYNISTEADYVINTNGLLTNEKAITDQVAQSLDSRFLQGDVYLPVNTKTTKVKNFTDKTHQYNTKLQFEFKTNLNKTNTGFLEAPTCLDVVVNGLQYVDTEIATTVFSNAFNPNTLNYIVFNNLPTDALLYAEIASVLVLIVENEVYDFSTITTFYLIANDSADFGSPYTTFNFKARDNGLFSNEATATVNLIEDVAALYIVVVSNNLFQMTGGNASGSVSATIFPGTSTLDSILWEFNDAPYADTVLTDTTTDTVTFTTTSGDAGFFRLKITATPVSGDPVTAIVTIFLSESIVSINATDAVADEDTQTLSNILLENGIEGETVDVIFDYNVYTSNRYALVNYGDHDESLLSLQNRLVTNTYTFDASGEIAFQVFMEDFDAVNHQNLTLQIINPSGSMELSKTNNIVVL